MNDTPHTRSSSISFSLKPSSIGHSRPWRRSVLWRTAVIGVVLYFSRAPPWLRNLSLSYPFLLPIRTAPVAEEVVQSYVLFLSLSVTGDSRSLLKMPVFSCRLFQRLYLDGYFIITPVSISDDVVELHIAPCKGDRLIRAERLLQLLDEAWAQEDNQTIHIPTSPRPFKRRPNKATLS